MSPTGYRLPGVLVDETAAPVISTPSIGPPIIGLVGDGLRGRLFTEIVTIPADDAGPVGHPYTLAQMGIDLTSVVVTDLTSGVIYALTTDYTLPAQTGTWPNTISTLKRTTSGAMTVGAVVQVTYRYADSNYYNTPLAFSDYNAFQDFAGSPFKSDGTIQSNLGLAGMLAFLNGATTVVACQVKPSAFGAALVANDWKAAIDLFLSDRFTNILVPVCGDDTIANGTVYSYLKQHVNAAALSGILRVGFIGRDGSALSSGQDRTSDLVTTAGAMNSSRMMVIGPSALTVANGVNTTPVKVGGQYLAAALAGVMGSLDNPAIPLTGKQVSGFVGLVASPSLSSATAASASGVCLIHQNLQSVFSVYHGVTSVQSPDNFTREMSIQFSRDRLNDLIRETLVASDLIGGIINDATPDLVLSAVEGALQTATDNDLIQDYTGIAYSIDPSAPTTILVRFLYSPTLPLNYILVQYAIDTSAGTVSDNQLAGFSGAPAGSGTSFPTG